MMSARILLLPVFMFLTICSGAEERRTTLYSSGKDRLKLVYEMDRSADGLEIRFTECAISTGDAAGRNVRRQDDFCAVFFDRTGSYEDVSFLGLIPKAFMIPSDFVYARSADGYFMLADDPVLDFKVFADETVSLSIPVYLAVREGKRKYRLLDVFEDFILKVEPCQAKNKDAASPSGTFQVEQQQALPEGEGAEDVVIGIETIESLLELQTRLPFSESLQYEITRLKLMKDKITDRSLSARIRATLMSCEEKRTELEAKAIEEEAAAKRDADRRAALAEAKAKAERDSLAVVQQRQEEAEKRKNMWMIVGGAALAVLGFIGNQVMQFIRNRRNQRNIMEMQQSIARRAESEAKNRIRSAGRKISKGNFSI